MARVRLNEAQEKLRKELEDKLKRIAESGDASDSTPGEIPRLIKQAGDKAHLLHISLKEVGIEPKHHRYLREAREALGVPPEHPRFYDDTPPIEDLLKFIANTKANDDPADRTIGDKFDFRVYSRRWGHDDVYRVIRTADGWNVSHIAINGPCDKTGEPILFLNFNQDYIVYPNTFGDWMESLWDLARDRGLSHNQVQRGLNDLAKWVRTVEQAAPSRGVWKGYA